METNKLNGVKIVGAGVDTLVLNVMPVSSHWIVERRKLPLELREELEAYKSCAQETEQEVITRFVFAGANLLMREKGSAGFNWIMHNSSLTLALNRGAKMVMLAQVRLSSEYLWGLPRLCTPRCPWGLGDLARAIAEVHTFVRSLFGEYILLSPSGCDLALDVVWPGFGEKGSEQDIKERFISRAQLDDERPDTLDGLVDGPDSIKRRWRRVTGLPFGARTGAVSALIYDKTHEIKYRSPEKVWFHDLWRANGWDGETAVWRIEVRFKRQALHEMKCKGVFHGIEDAYDLEEKLPGLWSYMVGHVGGGADGLPDGWLRSVIPCSDSNRSRWRVDPAWEVIQGGFPPFELPLSEMEQEEQEQEELWREVDAFLDANPDWLTRRDADGNPLPKRKRKKAVVVPSVPAPVVLPAVEIDLAPWIRKRKREKNMRRMVAQIAGCLITAEAWRRDDLSAGSEYEPDLSMAMHAVYSQIEGYFQENRIEFEALVKKRRVIYSLEAVAA